MSTFFFFRFARTPFCNLRRKGNYRYNDGVSFHGKDFVSNFSEVGKGSTKFVRGAYIAHGLGNVG